MMNNLTKTIEDIKAEIEYSKQCRDNLLSRLDEDIARINERKEFLMQEFGFRIQNLEKLIGVRDNAVTVQEEVNADAD